MNDWSVGFGSACFALGYAAKAFWFSRRDWRLWTVIAALFALFTALTIPVLSQMEKVPVLFMGPLANIEFLIAFAVLDWFIGEESRPRGSVTQRLKRPPHGVYLPTRPDPFSIARKTSTIRLSGIDSL
jgi:hypothetical protein